MILLYNLVGVARLELTRHAPKARRLPLNLIPRIKSYRLYVLPYIVTKCAKFCITLLAPAIPYPNIIVLLIYHWINLLVSLIFYMVGIH